MPITKNTMISASLATVISVLGGLWFTVDKVQGAFNQISMNTQAIQDIGTAMELRGIDRVIESKSKEIREKEIAILNAEGNEPLVMLLRQQNKKLAEEIEHLRIVRACVVDPTKKVCK